MDYFVKQHDDCYQLEWFVDDGDLLTDMDLICSFCMSVYREPLQDSEGHIFGKSCINKWIASNKKCPISSHTISKSDFFPNQRLEKQIQKLTVKCPLQCIWRGLFKDLNDHLLEECQKYHVQCQNEGCPDKIPTQDIEQHQNQCQYSIINCPLSQQCPKLMRMDLQSHLSQQLQIHVDQFKFIDQIQSKHQPYQLYDGISKVKINFNCQKCNQQLVLLNRDPPYHCQEYRCDICTDCLNTYSFRCHGCDFDVCLVCNFTKKKGLYCRYCPGEKRMKISEQTCEICNKKGTGFICQTCNKGVCKKCRSCLFQ